MFGWYQKRAENFQYVICYVKFQKTTKKPKEWAV